MKKLIVTLISAAFLLLQVQAQTTITYSMHGHEVGDVVEWWGTSIPDDPDYPGPSGENVVWHFTDYVATTSHSNEYVDPANTPFAAQAGSSNLAIYHNIVNNDAYTFCSISSQNIQHTGGGWTEGGGQLYYDFDNPVTLQKFPFSYEDEFTDTYSYTIDYNALGYDMVVEISGSLLVVADAWGQIHTPLGVYDDALRLQETYTETVSTYIDGTLISTNAVVEYFFKWYAPNRRAAVYEYHYIAGDELSHAILYSDNSVDVDENQGIQLQVFPNPASKFIRVKLEEANNTYRLKLVNTLGQVVQISTMGHGEVQTMLPVDGLKEGFYVLNISTSEGDEVNRKILIKR